MSLQHFGKGALRIAKNYTKGYSDTQAKVRDATSNDPWGPSGTQMNELAQLTYNQSDFVEIMEMLDKRLNDKGKNWRHVFKSLTVLDYLLHAGSENVVLYFKDNLYVIKTLKEFQYIDEDGKDCGANNRTTDEDDLRRAIEASKRSLAEEQSRATEDRDLETAIRLSKEEEMKRNKAVEDSNAAALFDDQAQIPDPTSNSSNPFPFLDPSPYAAGLQPQPQLQPQFTIQPQYTMQPQFTSFNPYQQQAQQEAMQAEYMRQQQEWLLQQQEMQAQQQQALLQQQQQEEWLRQQQALQAQHQAQQPLFAQPTGFGSNNPFAPSVSSAPASSTPVNGSNGPVFNLQGTFANSSSPSYASTPSPAPPPPSSASFRTGGSSASDPNRGPTRTDQEHSHLANLLANRDDGLDTFGNIGMLRYGQTQAGRIAAQKTGVGANNPFAQGHQQSQPNHTSDQPFFSV
ncbi:ENTH-domain-containing protein [Pisolithus albus]|nr:ENTH-domain-containing protein [Pisolithus albus]